ncbi:MauE/DoxX family redox-associated membrane protein [Dactylosporangium sp. NPDC051541]|uniref:MauE/DoxX family redox-associated membrane protein n=1 Tax=Dactylosporangium sp. NPDC051541 TaxID=3363977 RepID=UPI00379FF810
MGYLEVAARLLLATVFAVALFGKVTGGRAYAAFADSIARMRVLPARVARPAALASVVTEGAVVLLLVLPWRWAAVAGFVLAAGLLAVFAAAIAISLRGGNRAPCRCFGASATPLGRGHIVRNLILIVIALTGLAAAAAVGAGAGAIAIPGAVVAGAAGLVAGIVVTAYDDIVTLFR